ncbi:hypothetical protein [Haloarchaeobius amylolyticus]|uniref:hypothetical protein n=1 Tax=Haloarchaeobius amylolyticus TaxID=1198296 RepID=UPI002271419A|nr:hypothetical protein [Haloarchaeobius amylolyticus]
MSAVDTLLVCALAGLVAAVVMDLPMFLMPEGFTPASVAAAKLTRQPIEAVSQVAAQVVHHGTGLVGGLGLGAAVVVLEPQLGLWSTVILATTVLTVFIINFFGFVVLPRAGFDAERRETVFQQWLFSAVVYGVVVAAVTLLLLPS